LVNFRDRTVHIYGVGSCLKLSSVAWKARLIACYTWRHSSSSAGDWWRHQSLRFVRTDCERRGSSALSVCLLDRPAERTSEARVACHWCLAATPCSPHRGCRPTQTSGGTFWRKETCWFCIFC